MKNFVINRYLVGEFLKSLLNVILIFCCLGLIMNLFEEINYFKNYDVGITLPIILSFMVVPSIIVNMLPFVIFLSSVWVIIKLKGNRDVLSLKTFGFSNLRFLFLFASTAFLVGVLTLTAINPVTSLIVKSYEDLKGKYEIDKSHLASITSNGIWMKETIGAKTNIIKAKNFEDNNLFEVSIYRINDKNNSIFERIEAKSADISKTEWILYDGYLTEFNNENISKNFDTYRFVSSFNKDKLNSIYSNLDTISFYKLMTNKGELVSRGYNEKLLEEKTHFYLSLPFFLVLMVCLATIFTLNSNERRQNAYYLILSIVICALIFYFKNFSIALGTTERIPLVLSVWSPVIILSLFCSIGIIQINEK